MDSCFICCSFYKHVCVCEEMHACSEICNHKWCIEHKLYAHNLICVISTPKEMQLGFFTGCSVQLKTMQ